MARIRAGGTPAATVVVLVLLFSVVPLVAVSPAEAAWPHGGCSDRNLTEARYEFDGTFSVGNRASLMDEIEDAFENWQVQTRRWNGQLAVLQQGEVFTMTWDDLDGDLAVACEGSGNDTITFSTEFATDWVNNPGVFEGIATHEWGHVFGLKHSGRAHSYGQDNPPSMATCLGDHLDPDWASLVTLSQDDEAAIQFLTDPSGSYRSFTANSSWEEGTQYWLTSSGITDYEVWSGGGGVDGSPKYAAVRPSGTNGYLVQTNRLMSEDTNQGLTVKARVNVRKYVGTDIGTVYVRHRYMSVYYGAETDLCQLSHDRDINDETSLWYSQLTWGPLQSCAPSSSTSWNYCTTGTTSLGPTSNVHGYDLKVYVWPRMEKNIPEEVYTWARLDRTRVLVDEWTNNP